jgi:hypothetical protein
VARRTSPRTAGALSTAAGPSCAVAGSVALQLAQLGLPDHLQPADTGEALHACLTRVLRDLPKAPRPVDRPGAVVALVGPVVLAEEVAHDLAAELGLPRSAVLTAGGPGEHLPTPEQARTQRAAWRRRSRTTIVVIDTPLTAAAALQTRALLDALSPASTWGVVEATRKPGDVGAWARAVGRVDALALTGVDETADPAAVLQLGIPVGRLGARKATASEWASLLTDRVAA